MNKFKKIIFGGGILICGLFAMMYVMVGESRENAVTTAHPHNDYYNQVAHYIAGTPLEGNGAIKKLTTTKAYHSYRKSADSMWNSYQIRNLSKIRVFQERNLSRIHGDVVFYPFSGPDILNAIAFFPQSKTFIMIGMEPPGGFVDVVRLKEKHRTQGLSGLRESVRQIMGHNFFHTKIMKINVGTTSLSSVAGILQFFIVRSGFDVAYMRNITFSPDGSIVPSVKGKNTKAFRGKNAVLHPAAVEIVFHKRGSSDMKKVIYVKANMMDSRFFRYGGFIKYLLSQGDYITILKAASYLMFRRQFDDVRNIILGQSKIVMQDSSGIPYHFFKDGKWDITFFGRYKWPIRLFAVRHQTDLAKDMEKGRNRRKLPFYYGYTSTSHMGAHLIIARRKENAVRPTISMDKSNDRGIETMYQGGHTVIREYR